MRGKTAEGTILAEWGPCYLVGVEWAAAGGLFPQEVIMFRIPSLIDIASSPCLVWHDVDGSFQFVVGVILLLQRQELVDVRAETLMILVSRKYVGWLQRPNRVSSSF